MGAAVRLDLDTCVATKAAEISLPAGVAIRTDAVWFISCEADELVCYSRE